MRYIVNSCEAVINEREFSLERKQIGWIPLHWAVMSGSSFSDIEVQEQNQNNWQVTPITPLDQCKNYGAVW